LEIQWDRRDVKKSDGRGYVYLVEYHPINIRELEINEVVGCSFEVMEIRRHKKKYRKGQKSVRSKQYMIVAFAPNDYALVWLE
jgi:hypothetical protein